MKTAALDPQQLAAVRTAGAEVYLRQNHWRRVEEIGWGIVWEKNAVEAIVPRFPEKTDYVRRVTELVLSIAQGERELSPAFILESLIPKIFDRVRIRLVDDALEDGRIGLDPGIQAIANAKQLLAAAAMSVMKPKQAYYGSRPADVNDYLDRVKLAPSERGSFVLVVDSPPPAPVEAAVIRPTNDPTFERKVAITLVRALKAAESASKHATGDLALMLDSVEDGVSANLCEAAARLLRDTHAQRVEVRVEWSPGDPVSPEFLEPVVLDREAMNTLDEAAREFRRRDPEARHKLRGRVIKLSRPRDATHGDVVVEDEESRKRIRVTLTGQDYADAVRAHEDEATFGCIGFLRRERHASYLDNPSAVYVHPVARLFPPPNKRAPRRAARKRT